MYNYRQESSYLSQKENKGKRLFQMEEKIIVKGDYSHSSKWLSVVLALIGIVLIPAGYDGGRFGSGGTEYYCMFIGGIILIALAVLLLLYIGNCEIVVTDARVYGKAAFGKRVDLPMDSVSAVGTTAMFNGIAVATSSGKISFLGLKNVGEVHKAVSDLLIKRQAKPIASNIIKQEIPQSNADELKKYKDLLDSGIISQEEFDAKKKQLLGL